MYHESSMELFSHPCSSDAYHCNNGVDMFEALLSVVDPKERNSLAASKDRDVWNQFVKLERLVAAAVAAASNRSV